MRRPNGGPIAAPAGFIASAPATSRPAPRPAPGEPAIAAVSDACLGRKGVTCRLCESACDPDAIRFRPALRGCTDVMISAEACTGCGACLAVCPAGALSLVVLAPETSADHERITA